MYISEGSKAEVVVDGLQEDATRRVPLVQATQVVGSFASISVKGEGRVADRCFEYYAGSTDRDGGTIAVLVVPREKRCKSANQPNWVIWGSIMGGVGLLAIALGLLWVYRDIAESWARYSALSEDDLLVT